MSDLQKDFFQQNPNAVSLFKLLDVLPQTYFYVKDTKSRFIKVNQLFLDNHHLESESEAIGKDDRFFHPPLMAEAYMAEDQRVMESAQQQESQVWMVLYRKKTPRWFKSTKTPIFNQTGEVIGIAGLMYLIENDKEIEKFFKELTPVIRHIEKHFHENISMHEMAQLSGLSSTHFNRRFQQLAHISPNQYLKNIRVQAARLLLSTTKKGLVNIAAEIGFTDQSHFTRRFREMTGMTPLAYRKRFNK